MRFRNLLSLGLACFIALSAQAATISFSSPQNISTSFKKLTGLAVADFNGDGKPDIAVTDVYSQNIAVYLNDGTGHFGTPVVTTLAISSIGGLGALVAGDVNEDGKIDLIVAPVAGIQVDVVLLGNGDGTFTQGNAVPGSYGFFHADLVDINADGHLDLVSGQNGDVYAALGDGRGDFTQLPVSAPAGIVNAFFDLAVGDYNGDKIPDFVTVGNDTGGLLFFAGAPGGNFSAAVTNYPANVYSPFSITSADFNGDGKLDLVIGSADIATLFYGNGDGTFQTDAAQEVILPLASNPNVSINSANPTEPLVKSADMNGDGTIDIVAADNTYDMLSVLLNNGTGKFSQTSPDYQAPLNPGSGELRLSDLNGDGLPDIIITNYETQTISIFLSGFSKTTSSVSIASSTPQTLVGSTVTVTAQVSGSGTNIPTGTVTLASGSTSYGQQPVNAMGQATFTIASLAAGQYPFTATYSGDLHFNGASNATALTQSITDFQATLPTATQSVAVGADATYNVTLTPLYGFTGTVTLNCSGLPSGFSCGPTSSIVSDQASMAAVVVSANASAQADRQEILRHGDPAFLALLGFVGFGVSIRKRRGLLTVAILALSLSAGMIAGCSGSSSQSKSAPYTGTSNFTITATTTQSAVTVSHQVMAILTVQ
jgi:hypothetical protein